MDNDNIINNLPRFQKIVPFLSGSVSVGLLIQVLFSTLQGAEYYTAVGSSLFLFLCSILLFGYLSKIEKDKDTAMLELVGRVIDDVFKHFGVEMAKNDPASTASKMNPIMGTIVHLVQEMQRLAEKDYKG